MTSRRGKWQPNVTTIFNMLECWHAHRPGQHAGCGGSYRCYPAILAYQAQYGIHEKGMKLLIVWLVPQSTQDPTAEALKDCLLPNCWNLKDSWNL